MEALVPTWTLDEEESPDPEHHRTDEPGLKCPEQILRTGSEEQQRD